MVKVKHDKSASSESGLNKFGWLQGTSLQSVFSKLTLMDRNLQVRFFKGGFDILRLDIVKHYNDFLCLLCALY